MLWVRFDLNGLTPASGESGEFVSQKSPNAWEKVSERLLPSSQPGGQRARHSFDVVRFAGSGGCESSTHRPKDWRYRGYGVDSFSDAKPYKEFP